MRHVCQRVAPLLIAMAAACVPVTVQRATEPAPGATQPSDIPAAPSGPTGEWCDPVFADAFRTTGGQIDRNLWGYATTMPGNATAFAPPNNKFESQLYD